MASGVSTVYLLLEWQDEDKELPSYDVVPVNRNTYHKRDVQPGTIIFIRLKPGAEPRPAMILRISENKTFLKEEKLLLERQDQQIQKVMCMVVVAVRKNSLNVEQQQQQSSCNGCKIPIALNAGSSDSEVTAKNSSSETSFSKSTPKKKRLNSTSKQMRGLLNANNSRRRAIISSTPVAGTSAQENIVLGDDQRPQTGGKIVLQEFELDKLESLIRHLYKHFNTLASYLNVPNWNRSTSSPESKHNDEAAPIQQNVDAPNNLDYEADVEEDNIVEDNIVEDNIVADNSEELEELTTPSVRRKSAETTNKIDYEMVPIGYGHARVPARVLKEIDWNSYTIATRKLLMAVFSRSVLATHNLTGKQSPAFSNKPKKEMLDPQFVDDIVQTVSNKSGVAACLVRRCIIAKCADEAKRSRMRLKNEEISRRQQQDDENDSLSSDSAQYAITFSD